MNAHQLVTATTCCTCELAGLVNLGAPPQFSEAQPFVHENGRENVAAAATNPEAPQA